MSVMAKITYDSHDQQHHILSTSVKSDKGLLCIGRLRNKMFTCQ